MTHSVHTKPPMTRRSILKVGLASALAAAGPTTLLASTKAGDGDFVFEIVRSEAEWKNRLSDAEFKILRRGSTELPKSNPLWNETRDGTYSCRGCDLHTYDAVWKVILDKGWAFFKQGVPNSVLLGIDGLVPVYGSVMDNTTPGAMMEAHCRRCGSHLGHIVIADGMLLHCINGTSLTFSPATT